MAMHPTGFTVNAILCDSAVAAEGKLYVQGGGWNILGTNSFPFNQPRIGVGVVVGIPYTATNQTHTFGLHLEDEDGRVLSLAPSHSETDEPPTSINAQFNIGRPPHIQPGDAQTIPFAINLDQLRFETPSAFAFVMKIDGTEIERLVFRVMLPVGMLTA